jgi:hypothetical protein
LLLRRLRPLHAALREAVAEAEASTGGGRSTATLRRYQRVMEIRSAQLALRPYQDPVVPVAAGAARFQDPPDGAAPPAMGGNARTAVKDPEDETDPHDPPDGSPRKDAGQLRG